MPQTALHRYFALTLLAPAMPLSAQAIVEPTFASGALEFECGDASTSVAAPTNAIGEASVEPLGVTRTGEWCLATVPLEAGREWRALLHEGHAGLVVDETTLGPTDSPPQYALTDLNGDGELELISSDGHDACGMPSAYLQPRVYSPGDARLRPVTLRPSTAGVEAAALEPAIPLASPQWALPLTFTSHTASGLPGGGSDDALGTAKADTAAWRPLTDLAGVGAWATRRASDAHTATAIELRAAEGAGSHTLLVSTPGWLRQLDVSDELVRVPLPLGSPCVTVQIIDTTGARQAALDVARIVTAASEQRNWVGEWALPALLTACEHSPISLSRVTQTLSTQTAAYTELIASAAASTDCVRNAVIDIIAHAPANDPRRLDWLLNTELPEHRERLLQGTELNASYWLEALLDADEAQREIIASIPHDNVASPRVVDALWPPSRSLPESADRLLDGLDLTTLEEVTLPRDVSEARRIVAILARAAPTASVPDWTAPLLRAAIAHRDGTVARLALVAVERHAIADFEADVRAMLRDDPLPLLRVAALSAWLAVSNDDPQPLLAELATTDPNPSVRLAAAARWQAPTAALVSAGLAEDWPEVQALLAERAVAQDSEQAMPLLAALLAQGTRLPLPLTCPSTAWVALLDDAQPGTRSFRRLVHSLAECQSGGWPELLEQRAAAAPEGAQAAWLGAVAGTPLALPLARNWLASRAPEPAMLSAEVLLMEGTDDEREQVFRRAQEADGPAERAAWQLLLGGLE